ncbi:hypothetical protein DFH09DRAFT_1425775 [Mycena vulgaris]|nr:hypothetical protein DFH09DRAFT_1425775 [Mycena vulgaris]
MEQRCDVCKIPVFQAYLLPHLTQRAELDNLLRSNDSRLLSHFATHCQLITSSSPAELQQYDAEIIRLKAALEKMEHDRAAVEEYSLLCRSILSPIRRLPSEILIEIFGWLIPGIDTWGIFDHSRDVDSRVVEEKKRLANADLLGISQVCASWHRIIMGTPALWSVIDLKLCRWVSRQQPRMTNLLKSVLDREGNFPLTLGVQFQFRGLPASSALRLLAQHSRRWKIASISVAPRHIKSHLSALEGNLPLLETLMIDARGGSLDVFKTISFFAVAPRLADLRFRGPLAALAKMPLEQLNTLVYFDAGPQDLDAVIPVMARLAAGADCQIRADLDYDIEAFQATISAPTTSNIDSLLIAAAGTFDKEIAKLVPKNCIFRISGFPIPWTNLEFAALSRRSSFHAHLKCLELDCIIVTEDELIQTLCGLQALEDLVVSDHMIIDGEGVELELITNSLLQRLTWTPNPTCLVPNLSFLGCHTLLRFDDGVYRDFVLSRVGPGRNEQGPFEVELECHMRLVITTTGGVPCPIAPPDSEGTGEADDPVPDKDAVADAGLGSVVPGAAVDDTAPVGVELLGSSWTTASTAFSAF